MAEELPGFGRASYLFWFTLATYVEMYIGRNVHQPNSHKKNHIQVLRFENPNTAVTILVSIVKLYLYGLNLIFGRKM